MDDLVKRLRDDPGLADCEEAADRIEALEARGATRQDGGEEAKMKWTRTDEALPEKPGLKSYEYVWCLLKLRTGEMIIRPWNCEHLCWDDEHMDDFEMEPKNPEWWIALDDIPGPGQ